MRILVTGSTGQVANALAERGSRKPEIEILRLGRPELDLENAGATERAVFDAKPDVVVNAAAYTAVDKAESEPERAFAINRDGAVAVARAAARLRVPLVHLSTDYVFDGRKADPYVEADQTSPINVYGQSKLEGEQAVASAHPAALILRTSWVFSPFGTNFVKTMIRLGAERPVIRVVDDQIGNPTSAFDIADAILQIAPELSINPTAGGLYHFCCSGSTSWHGFAHFIFSERAKQGAGRPSLEAIPTKDYPVPARRPANSRLATDAIIRRFGLDPRHWTEAAAEVLARC